MPAPIIILGKDGQLGRAFMRLLGNRAVGFSRSEVDFLKPDFTSALPASASLIINAVAYTQVDKAEGEGKVDAYRVNAEAVGELAAWCKAKNLPLIHFSTDYVFDGSGNAPHTEDEICKPLNAYGKSKLLGEQAVAAVGGQYMLFRTSWVYDAEGKNFFTTMLRLMSEREILSVVSDQIGAPTYAPHLARAVLSAVDQGKFATGLYHVCAGGHTSWYDFATSILALAQAPDSGQKSPITCKKMIPIPTAEYPLAAPRPLNSRLDCGKAREKLGIQLADWREGLDECYRQWTLKTAN